MANSKQKTLSYKDAGVDIHEGDTLVDKISAAAKSTRRIGANASLGGFGALFDLKPLKKKYPDPILVSSTDGVGTKLKIAIESGIHNTVGIDLVAMCVNDLVVQGAEPLFFLDYYATGKLNSSEASAVIKGIAKGCKEAGCALIGGETAEMPGMYAKGDYDLAGFTVGVVNRNKLLPKKTIKEGDMLIGIASSGLHSNGFSLVRKIVETHKISYHDIFPNTKKTIGEMCLTPTRIYVKSCLKMLENYNIKALAHITGGGITGNLPRVLPEHLCAMIDLSHRKTPPIFRWVRAMGNIAREEMLSTFNCGVGMIAVVPQRDAANIIAAFKKVNEDAFVIGALKKKYKGEEDVTYQLGDFLT